jgi:hypothetical protein
LREGTENSTIIPRSNSTESLPSYFSAVNNPQLSGLLSNTCKCKKSGQVVIYLKPTQQSHHQPPNSPSHWCIVKPIKIILFNILTIIVIVLLLSPISPFYKGCYGRGSITTLRSDNYIFLITQSREIVTKLPFVCVIHTISDTLCLKKKSITSL